MAGFVIGGKRGFHWVLFIGIRLLIVFCLLYSEKCGTISIMWRWVLPLSWWGWWWWGRRRHRVPVLPLHCRCRQGFSAPRDLGRNQPPPKTRYRNHLRRTGACDCPPIGLSRHRQTAIPPIHSPAPSSIATEDPLPQPPRQGETLQRLLPDKASVAATKHGRAVLIRSGGFSLPNRVLQSNPINPFPR